MIVIAGFEWDWGNRQKCQKHGVSIAEIEELFGHGQIAVRPDLAHSDVEERFQAIGRTAAGRHLFLVFMLKRRDVQLFIRPISARYMHAREIDRYAKDNPGLKDR
jgi:uncharacterized DUF497 family protein